jgi:hypothetical protein
MKAYWGSGSIDPHILDLGTRWGWVVSFMPWPLYHQGKSPWYPLDKRLGGPQSWSWHGGEEKNSQPLPGLEPPNHPAHQPIAQHYTIELSWLLSSLCRIYNMLLVKLVFWHFLIYFMVKRLLHTSFKLNYIFLTPIYTKYASSALKFKIQDDLWPIWIKNISNIHVNS